MLQNKLLITPDMYQHHLDEALRMFDSNGRLSLVAPLETEETDEQHKETETETETNENENENEDEKENDRRNPSEECVEENSSPSRTVSLEEGSGLRASSVICQVMTSNHDNTTSVREGDSFTDISKQQKKSPPLRNSLSGSTDKLDLLYTSMTLIQRDIPRTFPTLSFFHDDGPLAASLDHVLKAYACYEPEIGYVQVS